MSAGAAPPLTPRPLPAPQGEGAPAILGYSGAVSFARRTAALLALLAPLAAAADTTRFAIVVGNNAGRGELPPLRFAEADAGKVARLLVELGDVAPENLLLLQGKAVADVEAAIAELRPKVAPHKDSPEARTVLLFYFSGHGDGEAIELGQQLLTYSRLKTLLQGVGTDVRVVVVDACRSGAGLRQKGGAKVEAFAIKLNDALATSGDAFITSSAEDEAALESNEVMGSIFTHNLVSGLRGAADSSGDRLVTLSEAYRYAFEQTVSRTALLSSGAQHPSYDYRLSGQGELVLTSLLKPSATLSLPSGAERSVVTDVLRDQVVVELPGAAPRELALPPGQYGVRLFKEGRSFGGRVTLVEGARKALAWEELAPVSASMQVARKGPGVAQAVVAEAPWEDARVVGLSGGVVPSVGQVGLQGLLRLAVEPRAGWGFSVALVGAHTSVRAVSESGLELRGGYRFSWQWGPLWLGAGAEVGPAAFWQSTGTGTAASFAGVVAPRAAARVTVGGPVAVTIDGEAAVALLSVEGRLGVVFRPAVTLGVALRF